jgi:ubiquinone/menaquinone biosynthesis C-methylase UbiE
LLPWIGRNLPEIPTKVVKFIEGVNRTGGIRIMKSLYDDIGKGYDTTRKADPAIAWRLRNHLQVPDGTKILDIACGTGNYTAALKESGLDIIGSDVSSEMIMKAKEKSNNIEWDLADVNQLPYDDNTFKGVTCILAIHHFGDLFVPFQEVYRVIDKGRFVIFTSSPEQMNNYWLKEYFPKAIEASAKHCHMYQKLATV